MLKNFSVKNFRCFRDLTIGPLERVNLIAGMNNTGKTALLEALQVFCNAGNADCVAELDAMRLPVAANGGGKPLQWIFRNQESGSPADLIGVENSDGRVSTRVWLLDYQTAQTKRFEAAESLLSQFRDDIRREPNPRLITETTVGDGSALYSIRVSTAVGHVTVSNRTRPTCGTFVPSNPAIKFEDAEAFSKLEIDKRQGEILPSLRILEPRLKSLAILVTDERPAVFADVGGPRQIPLHLVGEGIRRLLSILLAIANSKGGVVLIDEIENGLHYSVMPKVWAAIGDAARRLDVQVFATTHSRECIGAAHEAFEEAGAYDFRLFRLERTDGDIKAVAYDQETLAASFEHNFEVR